MPGQFLFSGEVIPEPDAGAQAMEPINRKPYSLRHIRGLETLLAVLLIVTFALVRGGWAGEPWKKVETVNDLNGLRLSVVAGTSLDNAANEVLDLTQIFYYDNIAQAIEAVLGGEVDALIEDQAVIRYLANTDPRLRQLEGILVPDSYGFAVHPSRDDLYEKINSSLMEIVRDGTLRDMEERWIDSADEATRVIPDLPAAKTGEVLRFGVSSISAPFCYVKDGIVTGLDIELMERVARRINRRLVVVDMEFSMLIPSLLARDVDVIGSSFSITPDRARIIRYTESYYQGGVAALVRADGAEPAEK
jgi:ABC-type amino acid transport/signal transduction systems, periplasmic component/domain